MGIHARNLIEFFTKEKKKDSLSAEDYKYESTTTEKDYEKELDDLNKRIVHISNIRTKNFDWGKCILKINLKLIPEIQNFLVYLKVYCLEQEGFYNHNSDKQKIREYVDDIEKVLFNLKDIKIGMPITPCLIKS